MARRARRAVLTRRELTPSHHRQVLIHSQSSRCPPGLSGARGGMIGPPRYAVHPHPQPIRHPCHATRVRSQPITPPDLVVRTRRRTIHVPQLLIPIRARIGPAHHPSRHVPDPTIRPPARQTQLLATPVHPQVTTRRGSRCEGWPPLPRSWLAGVQDAHHTRVEGATTASGAPGGRTIKSSPSASPLLLPDDPACADFDQVLVY